MSEPTTEELADRARADAKWCREHDEPEAAELGELVADRLESLQLQLGNLPAFERVCSERDALQAENEKLRAEIECWRTNKRCHVCDETRGGIPGNGQWIDDVLLCDYCHADHMKHPHFWKAEPADE